MTMQTEEVWRDIGGYEGLYQVSNRGAVKSLERTDPIGRLRKEKIWKQSHDQDGYLVLSLWKDGRQTTEKVHRLVAKAFIPNPFGFPEVNHKDENKENNDVANLEWCTTRYNLTYGHRLDCARGENGNTHKLTEPQVREIRRIYKKGSLKFGQSALAKKYGVSHPAIAAIVKGKTWKHIK